jgi:hypothetical protein
VVMKATAAVHTAAVHTAVDRTVAVRMAAAVTEDMADTGNRAA